jgi:NADH-quinone oxidoreductase subunit G
VRGAYAEQQAGKIAAPGATSELLATTAGADIVALRELAREIANASGAVILYDEMATREPSGETLAQDVLDLALLTNNYGRPGAGAGPLFEDNNSLGARDMGVLPDLLPGYVPVADAQAQAALSEIWGTSVPSESGLDYDAMLDGGVHALYVMGADPARHATPEQLARLESMDFLVVQDLFLTETAKRAAVVLPAVAYTEKDGTFTNTERCVQVVRRAMTELPGALADWDILRSIVRAIGLNWSYGSPAEILAEIARANRLYAGVSRARLGTTGARWPLAPGGTDEEGRVRLSASPYLTWEMLEHGLPAPGGELALSRGQGELA